MTRRKRSQITSSPKPKPNQNSMKAEMKRCRKQSDAKLMSRKKTRVDNFALLPDELLIEIFQKLSDNILRYRAKFVCRRWFDVITNKILLNHASLILERTLRPLTVRLLDITEEKEVLKTKDQFLEIPFKGRIKSWCNEFILMTDNYKQGSLYIFNLLTQQGSFLPSCTTSCEGHYGCQCGVGLAYDGFKGVYKVVHMFWGSEIQCELLIFKGDNITSSDSLRWKKIKGPNYTGEREYFWDDPVLVQGRYFHWDVHCSNYLVSMDSVKERFRLTYLPGSDGLPMNNGNHYSLAEMGGFLTLLHKVSFTEINIWMLKDYRRTKWEKLQSISFSSTCVYFNRYHFSEPLYLISCMQSKRYLILKAPVSDNGLYSFDMKNKVCKKLDIDIARGDHCVAQSLSASFF